MFDAAWEIYRGDPHGFWLNVLSNIPFVAFDILIIAGVLPFTIEWWNKWTSRSVRADALSAIVDHISDHASEISGRFDLAFRIGTEDDFAFIKEWSSDRKRQFADFLPAHMVVLTSDDIKVVFEINKRFNSVLDCWVNVCRQRLHHPLKVRSEMIDDLQGLATALGEAMDRCARMGGKRYAAHDAAGTAAGLFQGFDDHLAGFSRGEFSAEDFDEPEWMKAAIFEVPAEGLPDDFAPDVPRWATASYRARNPQEKSIFGFVEGNEFDLAPEEREQHIEERGSYTPPSEPIPYRAMPSEAPAHWKTYVVVLKKPGAAATLADLERSRIFRNGAETPSKFAKLSAAFAYLEQFDLTGIEPWIYDEPRWREPGEVLRDLHIWQQAKMAPEGPNGKVGPPADDI